MAEPFPRKTAFVTGAARGIGAETAVALAATGYDIALGFKDPLKRRRVQKIINDIEELGGQAIPVLGDITQHEGRAAIHDQLSEWPSLNALILNAAGGLEKARLDADPDYALHVNSDGQIALLDLLMPKLRDSSVIYVTSDWAHAHGKVELPPFDYAPIASSKQRGELALRGRRGTLAMSGSRLLVATAGLVTGTFVGDRALKIYPDFAQQQAAMGNVISADHVGRAIAQMVENPDLPNGHTEWIGADQATFMEQSRVRS